MTGNSFTILFASLVLCCVVLVTESRSTQLLQTNGEQKPRESFYIDDDDETSADTEESRFLSGGGTGSSTANAINDWITREQQALEKLRPQGGTGTLGANVIYVDAGASASTQTSSVSNNNGLANLIIPQVVNAALGGRPRRRRRRPAGNRNINRNRGRSKPQVFLVRP